MLRGLIVCYRNVARMFPGNESTHFSGPMSWRQGNSSVWGVKDLYKVMNGPRKTAMQHFELHKLSSPPSPQSGENEDGMALTLGTKYKK